jgi:hypothetical protein
MKILHVEGSILVCFDKDTPHIFSYRNQRRASGKKEGASEKL